MQDFDRAGGTDVLLTVLFRARLPSFLRIESEGVDYVCS